MIGVALDGRGPKAAQLYRAVRDAILTGRLRGGARVPSTRELARDLRVSRNTAIAAYDQLLAEGYLVTRSGAGTFVREALADDGPRSVRQHPRAPAAPVTIRPSRYVQRVEAQAVGAHYAAIGALDPVPYDFLYGKPDARMLPLDTFRRCLAHALAASPAKTARYDFPTGSDALRRQIADHVAVARGIRCGPEQIVIVSGTQQALSLTADVLLDPGDVVIIEDPHYIAAREVLRARGVELAAARVDREGLDIDSVPRRLARRARLAHVTPSHQFPTGTVMSAARRLALIDWAARAGAIVFEDDYTSEFRFEGPAIQALAGIDTSGCVVYAGTFSKTISPSLRLAYLIVPPALIHRFALCKWLADWSAPGPLAEALAIFMAEGHYDRHLRRVRHTALARRSALLDAIDTHLRGAVRVGGDNAGLHVVLWLEGDTAHELDVVGRARAGGVGVYPVSPHYLGSAQAGLILGYAALDEGEIREGIKRLGRVLRRRQVA